MKRFAFLSLFLSLFTCVIAKESPYKIEIKMLSPIVSDTWNYSNDSLDVNIYLRKGYGYQTYLLSGNICFQLNNKTKHRLYIEWENARMMGQKPAFGSDCQLGLRLNTKKEDEMVIAESSSILRTLLVERYAGLAGAFGKATYGAPWGTDIDLRKNKEKTFDFILPIRFESGGHEDFKFTFVIKWVNTADMNLIQIGMDKKLVKKTIGSPDSKDKIDDDIQVWHYNNNADLYIQDDKVKEIHKL